ncbi:LLM class flavin-dependent oxidoreductase [Streptomyces sp. NPDC006990]|uniref:LLM class flavin-dependent oxidoreductase n=1 Tax=unclassified Streptomyces TaxID=2593676 RepID=UPI003453AED1
MATSAPFTLLQPEQPPGGGAAGGRPGDRYRAAPERAGYADPHGVTSLIVQRHHGRPDGRLPAPLALAGAFLGRTRRTPLPACAILAPLYGPLRPAEDIAGARPRRRRTARCPGSWRRNRGSAVRGVGGGVASPSPPTPCPSAPAPT